MPISEKSFRDRQAKAQLLQDTVEVLLPVFVPADLSLTPANFQILIGGIDAANGNVETLAVNYTNAATQRVAMVKQIRAAVTQALGYIKSNTAWITSYKAAKMTGDKFRNMDVPARVTLPPGDGGEVPPAEAKKRNRGQQAYSELASHLQGFINAISTCAGYAPPSPTITINKFNEHLSAFNALNTFISSLDGQLTTARALRFRLYFSQAGLQEKFHAVKDAVKGQYGQNSAQYAAVRSIKW